MTYRTGWSVMEQVLVRRERWPGGYNTKSIPLVYTGQQVLPDQPVLRLEYTKLNGSLQQKPALLVPATVQTAQEMYNNSHNVLENVIVPAGLRGYVVEITARGGITIETYATVIQGAIGVGGQVAGELTVWRASAGKSAAVPPGAILVVPGPINFAFLQQALVSGISGIIASSIAVRDLEGFLRADLIQLLDYANMDMAQAYLPPITLCLTEGLGMFAMPPRILNLLSSYQGNIVLLAGTTSTRQAIVPEVVISLPEPDTLPTATHSDAALKLGVRVRICSGEHEGKTGTIDYFFKQQQVFSAGNRAQAVRVQGEDGSTLIIPLSLIERID